jgi:hypothetical protein
MMADSTRYHNQIIKNASKGIILLEHIIEEVKKTESKRKEVIEAVNSCKAVILEYEKIKIELDNIVKKRIQSE